MNVQIETILNEDSMKLVNSIINYTNSLRTLNEVIIKLRNTIHKFNLQNDFDCGSGSNHIWLSRLSDGERIALITEQ